MNTIAQHPLLWLLLAFLVGFCVEWILEVFYFRKPLADARSLARRRGEELDSERFAHSRTQTDLKAKLAELETATKGRTVAEASLHAARARVNTLEAERSEARERVAQLDAELTATQQRAEGLETFRAELASEVEGLRLQLAESASALATEQAALRELREENTVWRSEAEAAGARVQQLTQAVADLEAKHQRAAETEKGLQKRLTAAETALTEARGGTTQAQAELASHKKNHAQLESERTALQAKVTKLEQALADAKSGSSAAELKLKARVEEVKQLTAQLGEASEELTALKSRAAQLEANLKAAHTTRAALEAELAQRDAQPPAEPQSSAESAVLREELQEAERTAASWRSKAEELEAELLTTSRAHQALESELERLKSAVSSGGSDDLASAELESMTRERNELAAELAVLRSERKR